VQVKRIQERLVNLVDLSGAYLVDGVVKLRDNLFGGALLDVDIFYFFEHRNNFLRRRLD
jgi:hypothetical protein